MQGNNLNIDIAVNSAKARADLELLKAQLRATNKEVRDLANTGAKAGDVLPSRALQDATGRAGALNREIRSLNRTLATAGDVAETTGSKFAFSARGFRSLEAAVFNLGKQFGGIGIAAFAAFRALDAGKKILDDQIERLTKIRDLARETAQKPAAVAAGQNIARSIGEDAKAADTVLKKQAETFAKLQAERLKQGSDINVFRGGRDETPEEQKLREQARFGATREEWKKLQDAADKSRKAIDNLKDSAANTNKELQALQEARSFLLGGPQVLRGGKDPSATTIDLAKGIELLTDSTKRYADTKEGFLQYQHDLDVAFLQVVKAGRLGTSALNEFSKAVTGLPSEAAIPLLTERVAKFNQTMKDAGTIDPLLEAIKQLETQQGLLTNAWNKATEGMLLSYTNMLTAVTKSTREVLEIAATDWATAVLTAFSKTQGAVIPGIMSFLFGPSWAEDARNAFSALLDWMKNAAIAAANAIRSAISSITGGAAAGDPSIPAMPMASGGAVRGPGSGTSDSILARLSNGEFVMRARAVEHWGPRFMAALNSLQNPFGYHAGGLVRFAEGGLVAAGGGTGRAVHLHLGGSEFALSGAGNVVDALVTEANRQRMRSGGLKPSWYGGRVSG